MKEFTLIMILSLHDSKDAKIKLIFNLFDKDSDGLMPPKDIRLMIESIYQLMITNSLQNSNLPDKDDLKLQF